MENRRLVRAHEALAYDIEGHCIELDAWLYSAELEYARLAEVMARGELDPVQIELKQAGQLANTTRQGRSQAMLAQQRTFLFCAGVRDPSTHVDELRMRFGDANQRFRAAEDPAVMLSATRELRAVVEEVSALPLRTSR
jgi:hypothetical protein